MIKSIEMKRVEVTLFTLVNPLDIWEGYVKGGKRTALLLRMPKPPRISTTCLIGKGLYYKGRSSREIEPDR